MNEVFAKVFDIDNSTSDVFRFCLEWLKLWDLIYGLNYKLTLFFKEFRHLFPKGVSTAIGINGGNSKI